MPELPCLGAQALYLVSFRIDKEAEVRWGGCPSLPSALERICKAVRPCVGNLHRSKE